MRTTPLVNSDLASYYGVSSSATSSSQWVKTGTLDKRGGVLTLGAFMTVNAHGDKKLTHPAWCAPARAAVVSTLGATARIGGRSQNNWIWPMLNTLRVSPPRAATTK